MFIWWNGPQLRQWNVDKALRIYFSSPRSFQLSIPLDSETSCTVSVLNLTPPDLSFSGKQRRKNRLIRAPPSSSVGAGSSSSDSASGERETDAKDEDIDAGLRLFDRLFSLS
jgi:hypothetical protein